MDKTNKNPKKNEKSSSLEIPQFGISQKYRNPTPGMITIMNHGTHGELNVMESEVASMLKDLNLNAVMIRVHAQTEVKDIRKGFELLHNEELKVIVRNWFPKIKYLDTISGKAGWLGGITNWRKVVNNVFDVIKNTDYEEALGGWFMCDEPSYSVFWKMREYRDAILSIYKDRGIENPHIIYANLYPSTDDDQANGYTRALDFETKKITKENEYVKINAIPYTSEIVNNNLIKNYTDNYFNAYFSVFNPDVWSYDYYAFEATHISDNIYNYFEPVLRDSFFKDMMRIKKMSDLTGRPFWAYVYSVFYPATSEIPYARPTLGTMRFAALCALAFGAKGIVYWETFKTVKKSVYDNELPNYKTAAPIVVILDDYDENGNPIEVKDDEKVEFPFYYETTDIFEMVKTLNEEISIISSVMYESTFEKGGAYPQKPDNNKDTGIEVLEIPFGIINSIEGSVGFIISKLRATDGKYVYMIVNQDYKASQQFSIAFDKYVTIVGNNANIKFLRISGVLPAGGCVVFKEA